MRSKVLEPLTGELNMITTIARSSAQKRNIREIASIEYGPPTNGIKRADGLEICFLHDYPLVISA